ncbi:MAG: amidohydrolase family protein, partial [Planctomycetota bacterium]
MSAPVVDAHIHVQPWEMILPDVLARMKKGRKDLDDIRRVMASPAVFLKYMDAQGIERAVLVNYVSEVMGFTEEVNDWVAKFCNDHPDRLVPVGSVHARHCEDPAREMDRILALGIRAVKIHPSHQLVMPNGYLDGTFPALETIYRMCQEAAIPVMVHTGTSIFPKARNRFSDPMLVEDVAIDFPDLKLVLCHAGRPLWMKEAVFLARRFPQVYLDISSIPPAKVLEYLPELERLSHKVLWGTDWPAPGVPTPADNVRAFES